MDPKNPGAFAYFHPIMAALGLVLAFIVLRQGLKQRDQRTKRIAAPAANLKRHVSLGPWAAGIICASAFGGVGTTVLVRGWKPLATAHGWFGLACAALFAVIWWLGRKLVAQQKHLANRHGVLGLLAMFAGVIAVLFGIELLP